MNVLVLREIWSHFIGRGYTDLEPTVWKITHDRHKVRSCSGSQQLPFIPVTTKLQGWASVNIIVTFSVRYKLQLIPTSVPSTSFHSWHGNTHISILPGNWLVAKVAEYSHSPVWIRTRLASSEMLNKSRAVARVKLVFIHPLENSSWSSSKLPALCLWVSCRTSCRVQKTATQ